MIGLALTAFLRMCCGLPGPLTNERGWTSAIAGCPHFPPYSMNSSRVRHFLDLFDIHVVYELTSNLARDWIPQTVHPWACTASSVTRRSAARKPYNSTCETRLLTLSRSTVSRVTGHLTARKHCNSTCVTHLSTLSRLTVNHATGRLVVRKLCSSICKTR